MTESLYNRLVAEGDDPDAPERVRVEHRGDRAVVTLYEPDRLNVLSAPLVRQLRRALTALDDDPAVRAVVLTGADPGFSAGGDLTMMSTVTERRTDPPPEGLADVWRWIRRDSAVSLGLSPHRTRSSSPRSTAPPRVSAWPGR